MPATRCVFSIDVEDWFHIMDLPMAPRLEQWGDLPRTVARNTRELLDLLSERGIQATFFVLGWVAEREPALVRGIVAAGHEVASHGYAHDLIYQLSREEFREDVIRARKLLEDAIGKPVAGYRAPGFSVTPETPWFFDVLAEAGYAYSSSIFPAVRQHGGMLGFERRPHSVGTAYGPIVEFPISVNDVFGRPVCFFGGGYLRLFPYRVIKEMAKRLLAAGQPVVFYLHPREIDPHHPRLPMSRSRAFKSYVGLRSTRSKINRLFAEFVFVPFQVLYEELCGSQNFSTAMPTTSTPSTATPADRLTGS